VLDGVKLKWAAGGRRNHARREHLVVDAQTGERLADAIDAERLGSGGL